MLEVSREVVDGEEFLKIRLLQLDADLVSKITSIDGWFKAREPMVYGLPYSALGEFIKKTMNDMVLWKNDADKMGTLVSGINTSDIPSDFIINYRPKLELREHQIKAFNLMVMRDSLLIADEEGVGKTIPVLCQHDAKIKHGTIKRGLYVTKAGLIYDVKNQAEKATDLNVKIVAGTAKKRNELYAMLEKEPCDLVIVSYETYRADINHFKYLHQRNPFDAMYIDEAHKAKNVGSAIGKHIHLLDVPQRYAITASPIINEIIDMYNILFWLGVMPYNYWQFRNKFCELDGWGNVSRYKNIGEIKQILQSNMLRRLKTQVLKDLPPVVNKNIYVELTPSQRKLYKAIEKFDNGDEELQKTYEELLADLEFDDVPSELAKYARLAQIAESAEIVGGEKGVKGSAKLKELEDLLGEIVERGEKAVVFSRSKRFTNIMYEYFSKYNPAIIHGDISAQAKAGQKVSDRQAQVNKFMEDDTCKVIFCTESASREGWTGTSANNVIFTSKPWSHAYVKQCIGRVWRFGAQKYKSINVYSIIAKDTIDERIESLLEDKQFVIESMVETPLSTKEILAKLEGVA